MIYIGGVIMYPQMEILETQNCILRPITLDDVDDLYEYYSKPDVVKFLPIKVHKTPSDTTRYPILWNTETIL